MEKIKMIGAVLILLGIFGIVLVMNWKFVGFAVSSIIEDKSNLNLNESGKLYFFSTDEKYNLEILDVNEVLSTPGTRKTLSISIKNIGKEFLNNCKLNFEGNIANWIYLNDSKGIAPGERVNFVFNLNVPDGTSYGNYSGNTFFICEETKIRIQDLKVRVFEGFKLIKVKNIGFEKKQFNVSYFFDNSKMIGDKIYVDISVLDKKGDEIDKIRDIFSINTNKLVERNIVFNATGDLSGFYYIYFSPSISPESFVKESILIGEPPITGFVSLNTSGQRNVSYAIFIGITLIGVFFIAWKGFFGKEETENKKSQNQERY